MIGDGSLNIVLAFSNVYRTLETIKATFEKNVDFGFKKTSFFAFFRTKNQHFSQKLP